jgi:lycopene cyclase domain-containing protein
MAYTWSALVGVAASVLLDLVVLRTRLLTRKAFWTAYGIVLVFQLLVNGVLTGRHLVVYDPGAIAGGARTPLVGDGRIGYAPVEDLLFGFALVLQTLSWWVWWGRRERRAATARASAGAATDTRRPVETRARRSSTR